MDQLVVLIHSFYAFLHKPWGCMFGIHQWDVVTKVDGKNTVFVCGNDNDGYRVKMNCKHCSRTRLHNHLFNEKTPKV